MRVRFFYADKEREYKLRDAFMQGVEVYGDEAQRETATPRSVVSDDYDVGVVFGVKSRDLWNQHKRAGKPVIMLDKGYCRAHIPGGMWEYCRVSVNSHHPTDYLFSADHPSDRFHDLWLTLKPWRKFGDNIIIAGSSAKYHRFYDLIDPATYVSNVIHEIREHSKEREIWYRPKPSYKDAVPVGGSVFSDKHDSLREILGTAHVMVTHGSNACFEALLEGVPTIILGEGITRSISSKKLCEINHPVESDWDSRIKLLSNLAYCQWKLEEFRSGKAWTTIRPQVWKVI